MAAQLQLSRDTEVYASVADSVSGERYYWKLPILDGFSFTQSTATTEVSISEMADLSGVSRRGRKMFTDAFEPAEWNMQLYARPHQIASGNIAHSTDELLWANFVNAGGYTHTGASPRTWQRAVTKTTTASPSTLTVDFDDSNVSALGTFDLYFVLGACGTAPADWDANVSSVGDPAPQTIYKIAGAVCNSVSMEFDIDGILTLDWSGLGSLISQETAMPPAVQNPGTDNWYDFIISDGIAHSNNNFIRNRLSTLAITTTANNLPYSKTSYELTLTGGSITFENNLTYLTPEELCVVNQPLGNVTGVRNVSGSFTCYLNAGSTSSANAGTSADLFDDLATAVAVVNNSTDLVFSIGGASTPKLVVDIPTAHLEIPTHQIEDIISLEMNFHALPSTIDNTDEATIVYHNA